jgi:hypothetical protein
MRHLIVLLVHLITNVSKLIRPGGVRGVVAESVLAKHQLLILNRSRRRAPNLRASDRLVAGFCCFGLNREGFVAWRSLSRDRRAWTVLGLKK